MKCSRLGGEWEGSVGEVGVGGRTGCECFEVSLSFECEWFDRVLQAGCGVVGVEEGDATHCQGVSRSVARLWVDVMEGVGSWVGRANGVVGRMYGAWVLWQDGGGGRIACPLLGWDVRPSTFVCLI